MTLVSEFHDAFDLPNPGRPTRGDDALIRHRLALILEEYYEVREALLGLLQAKPGGDVGPALQMLLKALCDLAYTVEGAAVAFGLDFEGAFAEVHRSNMSKLGEDGRPIKRGDGKVLKGPNYQEADMAKFVPVLEGSEA